MRVHDALPVGQHHQPAGADRHGGGFRFQVLQVVGRHARRRHQLARHPVDQEGAGTQAGLEDIAVLGDGRLGAEGRIEAIVAAIGARDHGGAEVDVGMAFPQHAGSGARALAVAPAGDDGRAFPQASRPGGRRTDRADHRAGRLQFEHRPLRHAGRFQYLGRPASGTHVEDAHRIGGSGRGRPAAGEVEGKEAVDIREPLRLRENGRLFLAEPDHPVEAGNDVERLAGDLVHPACTEGFPEAPFLGPRPLVQPHRARTERGAVLAKQAEGLALVRDRQPGDAGRIDPRRHGAQRLHGRAPPFGGILLEMAGRWVGNGDFRPAGSHGPALPVPGDRLGGRGGGIDADDEVRFHDAGGRHGGGPWDRRRVLGRRCQRRPASATLPSTILPIASRQALASPL